MPSDWWNTAFAYRMRVDVNFTDSRKGAEEFPALVVLRAPRFDLTTLRLGGADLRFIASDHVTVLPHELESVDANAATIWVKIPLIGAGEHFWIYWGNPNALDAQDPVRVWTRMSAVFHLDGDAADSAGGAHHGTISGAVPTTGIASAALSFDGVDDRVSLLSPVPVSGTRGSLSAWINNRDPDIGHVVYCSADPMGNGWGAERELHLTQGHNTYGPDTPAGFIDAGDMVNLDVQLVPSTPTNDGRWHHLAMTWDQDVAGAFLYLDGMLWATFSVMPRTVFDPTLVQSLGAPDAAQRFYAGSIDEVRFSSETLDATWFSLEASSMLDTLFAYGAAEALPN